MSPADLSDSELTDLLGRVPSPDAPAADLAQRIAARAAATPQTRGHRFAGPSLRKFKRHPIVWSAFIAANALAAAAAAASWDGARFDFNRLADLPHRVAASIHLPHHHHHESKATSHPGAKAPSPKIAMHSAPTLVVPRAPTAALTPAKVMTKDVPPNSAQPGHRHEHLADVGRASVRKRSKPHSRALNGQGRLVEARSHPAPVLKRTHPAVSVEPRSGEMSRPLPKWRKLTPEEQWKRHMTTVGRPGTRAGEPGYPDARWSGRATQGTDHRLSTGRSARVPRGQFRQHRHVRPNSQRFRFNRRR